MFELRTGRSRHNPFWLLVFLSSLLTIFQPLAAQEQTLDLSTIWADSVLKKMSLDQKIGQLFMIAAFSNKDEAHEAYISRMVREYHLGGLIFMQGSPEKQLDLVNRFQKQAKIPMMIAQDAEWGMAMRLKGVERFPYQMTMGAIRNDSLLYYVGKQMALELKAAGVQVSFSPVLDINNNPRNPVINYRSFGENKFNVARKGYMMMQGLQDHGVMACAKHFPGHGDTDTDSHYDLPVLHHSPERLDTMELYPFRKLAQAGIKSMMVAHLYIPALDSTPNTPTTLSPKVINGLIRDRFKYDGLIFTDALNMRGVTKHHQPGEVAYKAFLAGNDVLLFPQNVPKAARLIKEKVQDDAQLAKTLDQRVSRILKAKYKLGLNQWKALSQDSLKKVMNGKETKILRKKLYEAAITVMKNDQELLPLKNLDSRKIAYVQIGGGSRNHFDKSLLKYTEVKPFYLRKAFTKGEKDRLMSRLKDQGFQTVIMGIFGMSQRAKNNYGIQAATYRLSEELVESQFETILCIFGNPYSLKFFGTEQAIVMAYENKPEAEQAAAAVIFGGNPATGVLPVGVSERFREGRGRILEGGVRFGFSYPEEMGLDGNELLKIDSMANHYIRRGAMPGCAILVMRGNKIVYDKGFGNMAYDSESPPIDPFEHTYDVASITKVAATTLCVMHLVEKGAIRLDEPIESYLPELARTNKGKLTIRRLMQHNAGLPGWIAFYEQTYRDPEKRLLDPRYYSYQPTRYHTELIAPSLFSTPSLQDWVWQEVKKLEVRQTSRVRYSDIGMILLWRILEQVSGESLESLATRLFYKPLGMDHTFFKPFEKGKAQFCPPTEADTIWRQAIIQGFVHDPAAAILGGECGHAGLFSNVYDLAKLMLMLKNMGWYGYRRFVNPATIKLFTAKQLDYNRRGLGWDKPEPQPTRRRRNPASDFASPYTYGHTGFTGTCIWVDPKYDLVYIFLSNRTYPYSKNRLFVREHVRERVMDTIYRSFQG